MIRSPAFNEASSFGQACSKTWSSAAGPTIAESNPNELKRRLRSICKIKEILVLANDDAVVIGGELAKVCVGGIGESHIEDVLAIDAFRDEIHSQGGWQLVIDQKLHEA